MKTETKTKTHLIIGEGTPISPMLRIIISDGHVDGPGLHPGGADNELIERIAAALAEYRSQAFDSRSVCADHGYQLFADSRTGYRCPVCDPKPQIDDEDGK